jgi:hypothetical protein
MVIYKEKWIYRTADNYNALISKGKVVLVSHHEDAFTASLSTMA